MPEDEFGGITQMLTIEVNINHPTTMVNKFNFLSESHFTMTLTIIRESKLTQEEGPRQIAKRKPKHLQV